MGCFVAGVAQGALGRGGWLGAGLRKPRDATLVGIRFVGQRDPQKVRQEMGLVQVSGARLKGGAEAAISAFQRFLKQKKCLFPIETNSL